MKNLRFYTYKLNQPEGSNLFAKIWLTPESRKVQIFADCGGCLILSEVRQAKKCGHC